jgi:hypothetical protein
MIPSHNIFWRGLFPFHPAPFPYQLIYQDAYTRSGALEELWLFPDEQEAVIIRSPAGPGTAFPFQLTKEHLAWFIYKVKTWQVEATCSYDFTIESEMFEGYSTQYQGEFSLSFQTGRNIAENGSPTTLFPNEKDLLKPFDAQGIGGRDLTVVPLREHSVTYTETVTEHLPDSTSVSQTMERTATLKIFYRQELQQEPPYVPAYAWVPSEQETNHIGSYMKKDSDIACNLMFDCRWSDEFITGTVATSFATLTPESISFGGQEPLCNVVIQVPWAEEGVSFPMFATKPPPPREPVSATFSDITLTPIEFWEYQPPEE